MDNFLPSDIENPIAPITLSAFLQIELIPPQISGAIYGHSGDRTSVGSIIDFDSINQTANRLSQSQGFASDNISYLEYNILKPSDPIFLEEYSSLHTKKQADRENSSIEIDPVTGQSFLSRFSNIGTDISSIEIDPITGPFPHPRLYSSVGEDMKYLETCRTQDIPDSVYLSYLLDYSVWSRDCAAFKRGFDAGAESLKPTIDRLESIIHALIPKVGHDFSRAQFAGGFAESVGRDQLSINNSDFIYQSVGIKQAIGSLREWARDFPNICKEDAIDVIDDLQLDIQQNPPNQNRIGRRLRRLVALASGSEEAQAGTAKLISSLSDFTKNIIVIAEIVGVSTERVFTVNMQGAAPE